MSQPVNSLIGYDVIGDIHGCAALLKSLLERLGYREEAGVYGHPERQVIFLGDIIDRGPEVAETVRVVRAMVDAGRASMVLGNHEYMFIAYCTRSPASDRDYLCRHSPKMDRILGQTLDAFPIGSPENTDFVAWLRERPLFIDIPLQQQRLRAVHACWDVQQMQNLTLLNPNNTLVNTDFLRKTLSYGSVESHAINTALYGVNLAYPDSFSEITKEGWRRTKFRTKFWHPAPRTYGDIAFQPNGLPTHLAERELTPSEIDQLSYYGGDEPLLFIGHYWCSGAPKVLTENIACLDYGAVISGKLVAYQVDMSDRTLHSGNFLWASIC